jgi:mono/diheme cytochrome c family protein
MRRAAQYITLGAAVALCLGSFYPTSHARHPAAAQKGAARQPAGAAKLFKQHCATCHGRDGRGATVAGEIAGAPDMTDGRWQDGVPDRRMKVSVTHGRGGMPAFKGKLSEAEVDSLVSYVRGFRK